MENWVYILNEDETGIYILYAGFPKYVPKGRKIDGLVKDLPFNINESYKYRLINNSWVNIENNIC
jgi:hypothetical protein